MPSVDDFYSKMDDVYDEEEFQEEIENKKEQFGGLFDEETIAQLITAEHGKNEEMIKDIEEIDPGQEATIEGTVIDLGTLRTFQNDDGEGKVRNVRIDDGTGSVKLVLWDEETEMVNEEIVAGTELKVINGYVQDKGYGLQIQAGKWGEVYIEDD